MHYFINCNSARKEQIIRIKKESSRFTDEETQRILSSKFSDKPIEDVLENIRKDREIR